MKKVRKSLTELRKKVAKRKNTGMYKGFFTSIGLDLGRRG